MTTMTPAGDQPEADGTMTPPANPFPSPPADNAGPSPFLDQLKTAAEATTPVLPIPTRRITKPKRAEKRVRMALGPLDIDVRIFVKGPDQDDLAKGLEQAVSTIVAGIFKGASA